VYFGKHHSISEHNRPAVSHACHRRPADLARAQSGSAGGSIGNDEKSLSGSRETPRATEPSKPARRSKTETEAPSRASRKSGGGGNGGGNIDGAWVLTSVGTPCGSSSDTVVISSGKMVGNTAPLKSVRTAASLGRIRRKPELDHVRPLFRPQRIRHIPAIRWLCRKLERIKAIGAVPDGGRVNVAR
jgi:hypothetical protein